MEQEIITWGGSSWDAVRAEMSNRVSLRPGSQLEPHPILNWRALAFSWSVRATNALVCISWEGTLPCPKICYFCAFWRVILAPKNWCFWTVLLEKTLESPLDCKEIQPIHPEGDQSWVFIWRTDAEAETPVLWPPHAKSWLIGKDPDAGEGLGAGGEGDDRGWDGWMASPTRWTWVWANSGSWW